MKTRWWGTAGLLAAALGAAAASRPPDWPTLLRQGDAAYERGDYTSAKALYEQAGERTTDPGRVTFALAAAQVRLAEASDADRARLAREAEQSYRCCVGPGDPRRPPALYGLGNALLLEADGRDADALAAAVTAYQQCLAEADAALADDARHNLERARLLLRQIAPAGGRAKEESPNGDGPPKPKPPPDKTPAARPNPTQNPSLNKGKPNPTGDPAKEDDGQKPSETTETAPGEGNLPPVPDGADLPPLSAEDAARHLDMAAQRILQDLKDHRRAKTPVPPAGVRDW